MYTNTNKNGAPEVLIGIVTRDRAAIVEKAIISATSQCYEHSRIAVVDDGSVDQTPALAEKFPDIEWIRFPSPRGYLEARNHLMGDSDATYFISLDDDAWFIGHDIVATAVDYLENNPRVAAIAFDILSPDRPTAIGRSAPRSTVTFIGCGHVLRLPAVRDVGLYAPGPEPYGAEEKDLCLRLRDRGYEIRLLPGVHVWHDKTEVSRDLPAQYRSNVCNDLAFALRRCPLPMLMLVLPYKAFSHFRNAVGCRMVGPCLAGMCLFVGHCRAVWKERAPVRAATFQEFLRRSHSRN